MLHLLPLEGVRGGVVGCNTSYNGSTWVSSRASTISYSYNSANVTSNGTVIGGICGQNSHYCYVKDSYIASTVSVKKGSTSATTNMGSSSNYLGKIVGDAYSTGNSYISNVGVLATMPTVYHVVNGLNSDESIYWSSSELNAPKLLWEEE